MLAVTHHYLVQLAAQSSGRSRPGVWFSGYELLGDDIIIFDEAVADSYLSLMEDIGVPINLSKSVIARTLVTEFAKVTTYHGRNVSAISWKMFISQASMMGRVNIAFSLIKKGIYGRHVIAALRGLLARRRGDQGELNFSYVALLSMFAKSKKLSYEDLIRLLINKENPSKSAYKTLLSKVRLPYIENVLAKLCRGEVPRLDQSLMISMIYEIDSLYLIKALWTPIKSFFKRYDPETMERTEFDGILLNSQLSVLARDMLLSMLQPSSKELEAGVY
jgi:hypothetical protein